MASKFKSDKSSIALMFLEMEREGFRVTGRVSDGGRVVTTLVRGSEVRRVAVSRNSWVEVLVGTV